MIYLKNYRTDFMFLVAIVCVTYSSTILPLMIFNFPLVFKISLLLVEIYVYRLYLVNLFIISNRRVISRKQKRV